jgi:hypothetical protein
VQIEQSARREFIPDTHGHNAAPAAITDTRRVLSGIGTHVALGIRNLVARS